MNANEYINGMADLLRTTGAEYVKVEDVNGKKRIAARFPSVDAMRSEMKNNSNEFNSLTILNAQCRVMDMLLDAIKASRKDLSSTGKAAEDADRLIREQGLILAMTDDEEYVRNEVAEFVGRL